HRVRLRHPRLPPRSRLAPRRSQALRPDGPVLDQLRPHRRPQRSRPAQLAHQHTRRPISGHAPQRHPRGPTRYPAPPLPLPRLGMGQAKTLIASWRDDGDDSPSSRPNTLSYSPRTSSRPKRSEVERPLYFVLVFYCLSIQLLTRITLQNTRKLPVKPRSTSNHT